MKTEKRSFELRAAAEDYVLEGTAVSYDCLSQDVGGFFERIMPGAFTRSLKAGQDTKCLFNHDANVVLGRTKSGTLQLEDTSKGLRFRVRLDRNNTDHQNVYRMVKRGDLNECSFAFVIAPGGDTFDEVTQNGKRFMRRTVTDVAELRDIAIVTYPAYNATGATSVDARSTGASIDAYNRRRCEEIGRAVAEDRRKGHIS